ncbi:MAG: hypothetical protein P4M01_09380 [Acidobacteriota bacterium]|nr:hypothetical protein [Acidobacteriota bacterium]
MREAVAAFIQKYPLPFAIFWALAALVIACVTAMHYREGRLVQAFFLDFPFVLLAALAAAGSYLEWKSPPER